jgi:hypothetical protein
MIEFQITTGQLAIDSLIIQADAYAGAPGHVNDPSACALGGPGPNDHGPLPPGRYSIGDPVDNDHGPCSFPLTPVPVPGGPAWPATRSPAPGNFWIHADNPSKPPRSSSAGCIVAGHGARAAIKVHLEFSRVLEVTP